MLLTPDEVADALRCPRDWVDLLLKGRFLPCTPGRAPYIPERTLAKFMRARDGAAGPEADLMRLYDREGAAARLGISVEELTRRNRNGHIGYVPLRPVLYREADILNFMDSEARRAKEAEEQARYRADCEATAALLRGLPKIPLHLRPRIAKLPPLKEPPPPRPRTVKVPPPRKDRSTPAPTLQRQKNDFWYVCWSKGRRSMRQSTGTKDYEQAKVFLQAWHDVGGDLSRPRVVVLQHSVSVEGYLRRSIPVEGVLRHSVSVDAVLRQVRSGYWYLFWSQGTRSLRLSTKTKDETEAKRFHQVWTEAKAARHPKISGSA